MNLLQEAKDLPLSEARQWLHRHPETGFDLQNTRAYVENRLKDMGLSPRSCGKCGILADIRGEKPGKTVLLRADMDALPIKEETELPFASETENMHACGHDLHTAMLLGGAQLLIRHRKEFCGTVRLMFQPAEELLQGAADMAADGALEGVDEAVMLHVLSATDLPTGTAILPAAGVSAPSADNFTVCVKGQSCHGAMPHAGIDPIVPACHMVQALQTVQTRELPAAEAAVLTVGSFQAGSAPNVIADKALLSGTLRTYSEETRQQFKNRMTHMIRRLANAYRAEAEVTFDSGCPTLVNDRAMVQTAGEVLSPLLGEAMVQLPEAQGGGGSEDFAFISHRVPSLAVFLAAGRKADGHSYPAHHPKVTFDEAALPYGAAIYAQIALN